MEFRFQKLEIWQDSVVITKECYQIVDHLRKEKYYSFSDQLARASLSVSSNIAEGSGSATKRDFANYLNISRKSLFECANIIIILNEYRLIDENEMNRLLLIFKNLSAKIYYFRQHLLNT